MPSRNVVKIDIANSYYHVYARGHGKQQIFRDEHDYAKFLELLQRYLSPESNTDGRTYSDLSDDVSLNCYCLMPNHFHLLLHQQSQGAMSKLMRGVIISYSMYFNRKYGSSGAVFESRYKASRISTDAYLMHVSRYIHLNPRDWLGYPYSSIHSYFMGPPEWLHPDPIVELFGTLPKYADFLNDTDDYHQTLPELQPELANRIDDDA